MVTGIDPFGQLDISNGQNPSHAFLPKEMIDEHFCTIPYKV
jgi:hypothetical protein